MAVNAAPIPAGTPRRRWCATCCASTCCCPAGGAASGCRTRTRSPATSTAAATCCGTRSRCWSPTGSSAASGAAAPTCSPPARRSASTRASTCRRRCARRSRRGRGRSRSATGCCGWPRCAHPPCSPRCWRSRRARRSATWSGWSRCGGQLVGHWDLHIAGPHPAPRVGPLARSAMAEPLLRGLGLRPDHEKVRVEAITPSPRTADAALRRRPPPAHAAHVPAVLRRRPAPARPGHRPLGAAGRRVLHHPAVRRPARGLSRQPASPPATP